MSLLAFVLLLLMPLQLKAQQEFIIGKSANTLAKNQAVFSLKYSSLILNNVNAHRTGVEFEYGISNKLNVGISSNASSFITGRYHFESANLNIKYQWSKNENQSLSFFAQAAAITNIAFSSADINFDGNNAGFAIGFIKNLQFRKLTLAFTGAFAKIGIPKFIHGILDGYGILYQVSSNIKMLNQIDEFDFSLLFEVLGQFNNDIGDPDSPAIFPKGSYLDFLGGGQVTFERKYRIEVALQKELYSDIARFSDTTFHIRLKYFWH